MSRPTDAEIAFARKSAGRADDAGRLARTIIALADDLQAALALLRDWLKQRAPGESQMVATDTEEFLTQHLEAK